MENKVHRLERLLCYILLAFVGFVDLIHGSLSSNESRGTSSGSGNSEAGSGGGSTINSTGSHHSRREGTNNNNNNNSNNNNSRNTRNNNHNNNSHNNKTNITRSPVNSEHVFRQALTGRHLLAGYNHQQRPTTSLHHHHQHHHLYHQHHNNDQQLYRYKNLTDKVFFVRLDSNKFNQTKSPQSTIADPSTLNITNITREGMDSLFNQRASKINTSVEEDSLMHFQVKKQSVNDTTLVWLPSGNGSLPSSNGALPSVNGGLSNGSLRVRYRRHQQQHVAATIHRRKAPLLTNAALKTDKKVHVTITREPHETLNVTGIQINPETYRKERTKRDETYVLFNTTKNSKNRLTNWWDMMLSDEVVTVRDGDDAPQLKSNGYKEFSPPNQLAFLKRPPTNDVSQLGNTLSYDCEVDTSNLTVDPEIYWTIPDRITKEEKGPEDLYAGEFRHDVFVDDNHTLIIKNVQMEHRGMYICVASVGQVTEMVTMVLRVTRVTRYDLSVRLIVGFSVAFVVIVVFGSAWMVLRVMKNREIRAEEENSPTETTEIRRTTTDIHYFL